MINFFVNYRFSLSKGEVTKIESSLVWIYWNIPTFLKYNSIVSKIIKAIHTFLKFKYKFYFQTFQSYLARLLYREIFLLVNHYQNVNISNRLIIFLTSHNMITRNTINLKTYTYMEVERNYITCLQSWVECHEELKIEVATQVV